MRRKIYNPFNNSYDTPQLTQEGIESHGKCIHVVSQSSLGPYNHG